MSILVHTVRRHTQTRSPKPSLSHTHARPAPPLTHTQGVGGLPEADCGEGGEGGERRSHRRRSRGADVILPAYIYIIQPSTYIYIYISLAVDDVVRDYRSMAGCEASYA